MSDIPKTPKFFVPFADSDNEDSVYKSLAEASSSIVPSKENRIYSITFVHDGEEWTATVGKTLYGKTIPNPRSRSNKEKYERPLSDPATVLAIFSGTPYKVVTDHRIARSVGSAWENPFFVGSPKSITYFSKEDVE